MLGPVRVGGGDRVDAEPRGDRLHRLIVAEIEDKQRLRMGRRSPVPTARGQLEMRVGARHRKKHAVVAGVIVEAANLRQPDAISIERDELPEALSVSGDAQLHRYIRF